MKTDVYYIDFDVEEVSLKINSIMSRWSAHLLKITGQNWQIFDYDGELLYECHFFIDYKDIEGRIKLEDLKLNVIHHIESLRDDTAYIDNMIIPDLLY